MRKLLLLLLLLLLCVVCVSWNAFAFDVNQVQIHGFASQGYLRSNQYDYLVADTADGTFEFNEFGLNVMSDISDRLRVGIQLMARDLGANGNDKVTIDWAFGDYRHRNWLGFRAGKMKKAFGLYNQIRDIDAARTGVFLPLGVYPEDSRTAQQSVKGVALYGSIPGGFDYQIQYGTLDSEFERVLLDTSGVLIADVPDDNYMLHLAWNTPLEGLKAVGSFNSEGWSTVTEAEPENWEFDTDRDAWVVGLEYTFGEFLGAAEYTQAKFESTIKGFPPFESTSEAYYGLLSYRFTEWFELGASYSVSYGDNDDKEGKRYDAQELPRALAWSKDLAITTRFDPHESWIIKLEGHWINGLQTTATNGGTLIYQDYDENPSEDGFLGAVKVTFSF